MTETWLRVGIDGRAAKDGARGVVRSIDDIRASAKSAGRDMDGFRGKASSAFDRVQASVFNLRNAIGALGVGVAVRELSRLSDVWTQNANKLRLVTAGTKELTTAQNALYSVAQETRAEFGATVDLYSRLARSTTELGVSSTRLLSVTQAVNKAVAISGGTAQSAAGALFQLGQGLSAGALRGEELNSVLEGTPRLAMAIADGLGVTIGGLRALGAEGKITAKAVIQALESQSSFLDREYNTSIKTVSQSLTQLSNAWGRVIGQMTEANDVGGKFTDSIDAIRDAVESDGFKKSLEFVATIAGVIGRELATAAKEAGNFIDKLSSGEFIQAVKTLAMIPPNMLKSGLQGWGVDFSGSAAGGDVPPPPQGYAGGVPIPLGKPSTPGGGKPSPIDTGDSVKEIEKLRDAYANLSGSLDPVVAATQAYEEGQKLVQDAVKKGIVTKAEAEKVEFELAAAFGESLNAAHASRDAETDLEKARRQSNERAAETIESLDKEGELLRLRIAGQDDLADALETEYRIRETLNGASEESIELAIKQAKANGKLKDTLRDNARAMAEAERAQERMVDGIVTYGADRITNGLMDNVSGGWGDMLKGMFRDFKAFLIRAAAEAALRPIAMRIVAGVTGGVLGGSSAAAAGGTGSGGMGATDILSAGRSIFSASNGSLLPGMDAWAQSTFGWGGGPSAVSSLASTAPASMSGPAAFSEAAGVLGQTPGAASSGATAGLWNGGSATAGFSSFSNVLGIAGSVLPGLMSGNYGQAAAGGVGAAIGTAILPGIGTMIGGTLGNLVGGMFGGKEKNPSMSAAIAPVDGTFSVIDSRQKHLGAGAVNDLANGFVDATNAAVEQLLGTDVTMTGGRAVHVGMDQRSGLIDIFGAGGPELERLAQFSMDQQGEAMSRAVLEAIKRADFDGVGEYVAAALANSTTDTLDGLAADVKFAQSLETMFDDAEEAAHPFEQQLQAMRDKFAEVKIKAEELGIATDELSTKFEGAVDKFKQQTLSGVEENARALIQSSIGGDAPRVASIMAQVEQVRSDLLTVGGDTRLADMLLDARMKEIDGTEQLVQQQRQLRDSMSGVATTLRQARLGLLLDTSLSPLSPENRVVEGARQFNDTAGRARLGDAEAMAQLPEISRQYLEVARGFYASNEDYARIFDTVSGTLSETETIAERHVRIAEQQLTALGAANDNLAEIAARSGDPVSNAVREIMSNAAYSTGTGPDGKDLSAMLAHGVTVGQNRALGRLGGYGGQFEDGKHVEWLNQSGSRMNFWETILGTANAVSLPGFANGGVVTGGTPGRDSVPIMAMPGERVFSVSHSQMLERLASRGNDNGEVVKELRATVRVLQAGFTKLSQQNESMAEDLSEMRAQRGRSSAA